MAKTYGERWKTIDSVGEGGGGYIYRVKDITGRSEGVFALKRLKNIRRIDRFEVEIKALEKLDYPGINKIIDFSLDENPHPYFVTKLVKGKSFSELPKLPLLEAINIIEDLALTVAYANTMGVIHRDLKPENVMLDESGKVIVLDFGICYLADHEGRLTETQEQAGSRFFMAPEMGNGRADKVTYKADTYAIAKILYFLLTGKKIDRENITGDNDLKKIIRTAQADYITEKILLPALMVDPLKRCTTKEILVAIDTIRTLVQENFYPGIIGTKCLICGEGKYIHNKENRIKVDLMDDRNFGTPDVNLLILECNRCSNLQWFKHLPTSDFMSSRS